MPTKEFEFPIGGNLPWRTPERRDFFEKALIEMKEELFYTTSNSEIRLVENIELLATKMYFYSGLLIGN